MRTFVPPPTAIETMSGIRAIFPVPALAASLAVMVLLAGLGSLLSIRRALAVDPEIEAVKKGRGGGAHQIDAITGATISSKAVVRIINQANERWLPRLPTGEH